MAFVARDNNVCLMQVCVSAVCLCCCCLLHLCGIYRQSIRVQGYIWKSGHWPAAECSWRIAASWQCKFIVFVHSMWWVMIMLIWSSEWVS